MDIYDEDAPPAQAMGAEQMYEDAGQPQQPVESEESKILRYAQHLKSHRRRQRTHNENPEQFIKDVAKLAAFKKMTDEEKDSALLLIEHDYDSEEAIESISESVLGAASGYLTNFMGVEVDLNARPAQRSASIWILDKVATRMPTVTKFFGWAADYINIYNAAKKKHAQAAKEVVEELQKEHDQGAPQAKRAKLTETSPLEEEEEHAFRQHEPVEAFGADEPSN